MSNATAITNIVLRVKVPGTSITAKWIVKPNLDCCQL
jgi:hypothetical protein